MKFHRRQALVVPEMHQNHCAHPQMLQRGHLFLVIQTPTCGFRCLICTSFRLACIHNCLRSQGKAERTRFEVSTGVAAHCCCFFPPASCRLEKMACHLGLLLLESCQAALPSSRPRALWTVSVRNPWPPASLYGRRRGGAFSAHKKAQGPRVCPRRGFGVDVCVCMRNANASFCVLTYSELLQSDVPSSTG